MDFLKNLVKESGNKYGNTVDEGIAGSDIRGFVDTGSYIFNALLSGSVYGGIADNKIIAIAGESATGKTYFTLGIVHKFLSDNPDAVVLYFDSEQAVTSDMIRDRGIDPSRVAVMPVSTVEEFRHQAIKILDAYNEEKEKKPMMLVLDSLGMLSTEKEMNDTSEGKTTRDMTRAQVIKATFRVLTLKLGAAGVPMIMTNHTYDVVGSMFPTKEMGGGCLSENHMVLMSDGSNKPIQDIVVGDEVVTLFGNQEVLETFQYDDKETLTIEFEDGYSVTCTPNHKFLLKIDDEMVWVEAQDIIEGSKVVVRD